MAVRRGAGVEMEGGKGWCVDFKNLSSEKRIKTKGPNPSPTNLRPLMIKRLIIELTNDQPVSVFSARKETSRYNNWEMKKSRHTACSWLIVAILLLVSWPTNADSLLITNGQTVQLGLPGVVTNYSFSSVTVDAGGTLNVAGSVTLIVASNVLINGQMIGGSAGAVPAGMDGGDGADGVVMGGLAADGEGGGDGANGTNAVADAPSLTILAQNMIVNGSILFNPEADAGDGGDGGAAGKGADGLSPGPGGISGGAAGWGGPGGVGGYGGNSLGAPFLSINVEAQGGTLPNAGSFILGTNGVISLDNMGGGGSGGSGGDGGAGGKGGDGANAGNGGAGGEGVPAGFGGAGAAADPAEPWSSAPWELTWKA